MTDRALFTDLAQDEQQLMKAGKAFGIDTSEDAEFSHQREMAKFIGAWRQARTQYEVKAVVDAAAKAHAEPVRMLAMDWNSVMKKFKKTYGSDLCENELPAQSYYEEFKQSLAEGSLEAERLRDVVSEEEAQEPRKLKADPARQYGMHLDGKLTLQTRRTFTSVEPANQEQLRAKYTVLQNMWLLAQLRQPGRSLYKDPTSLSFCSNVPTSAVARKWTGNCCLSPAGRTACHMSMNSERKRIKCVVYGQSGLQPR